MPRRDPSDPAQLERVRALLGGGGWVPAPPGGESPERPHGQGGDGGERVDDEPEARQPRHAPRLLLDRRAAAVVLAVVVLAGLGAFALWEVSRPRAVVTPEAASGGRSSPPRSAGPGVAWPAPTVTPSTASAIVVHVVGKVRHPGVVSVAAGARVADAIAAAGGLLPGVDAASVNLARVLIDGEQVPVGVPGAPGVAAGAVPSSRAGAPALVDLNRATSEQLETLPGVGPATAQRIEQWRTAHGGFRSVDELRDVAGIGDRRFETLRPLVTV